MKMKKAFAFTRLRPLLVYPPGPLSRLTKRERILLINVNMRVETCCSARTNCSSSLQDNNCTFSDTAVEALQSSWSRFRENGVIQQRYNEAIDSMRHLCANIYPGTLSTKYRRHSLRFHFCKHNSSKCNSFRLFCFPSLTKRYGYTADQ